MQLHLITLIDVWALRLHFSLRSILLSYFLVELDNISISMITTKCFLTTLCLLLRMHCNLYIYTYTSFFFVCTSPFSRFDSFTMYIVIQPDNQFRFWKMKTFRYRIWSSCWMGSFWHMEVLRKYLKIVWWNNYNIHFRCFDYLNVSFRSANIIITESYSSEKHQEHNDLDLIMYS